MWLIPGRPLRAAVIWVVTQLVEEDWISDPSLFSVEYIKTGKARE